MYHRHIIVFCFVRGSDLVIFTVNEVTVGVGFNENLRLSEQIQLLLTTLLYTQT
jgi:hypothetical protein